MKTHLVFAIMTAALLAFVISQKRQTRFTFDLVVAQAQALAAKPYQAEAPITSPGLRALNYDQMRDIRWRAERTLWQEDGLPFQVQFLAAGGQHHADPVNIFTVHGDSARWIRYDPADFDFGPLVKIPEAGRTGGGLSGFRVLFPIKKKDALNEVLVFQGASYFRATARK